MLKLKKKPLPVKKAAGSSGEIADLFKGRITLIYGLPKAGKSSLLKRIGAEIFATEAGWNALGRDIPTYVDNVKKPLDLSEIPAESIVAVDTVDELHRMCVTATCRALKIETIGDAAWNKGRDLKAKMFLDFLAPFLKHEGGCVLVCHAREVTRKGKEILAPNALDKTATFALESVADTIAFLDIDDHKLWFKNCPYASTATRFDTLPKSVDLEEEN